MILKPFSLAVDLLSQCKGLKAIYDSLLFNTPDRRLISLYFFFAVDSNSGNKRFLETSEKSSCVKRLLQFMLHVKL